MSIPPSLTTSPLVRWDLETFTWGGEGRGGEGREGGEEREDACTADWGYTEDPLGIHWGYTGDPPGLHQGYMIYTRLVYACINVRSGTLLCLGAMYKEARTR